MTCWPFPVLLLLTAATTVVAVAHPNGSPRDYKNNEGFFGRFHTEGFSKPEQHLTSPEKTVLTVGYLTAIKGELKDKQGLAISGALTMALDEVSFFI